VLISAQISPNTFPQNRTEPWLFSVKAAVLRLHSIPLAYTSYFGLFRGRMRCCPSRVAAHVAAMRVYEIRPGNN
jgi:hypothetical protein